MRWLAAVLAGVGFGTPAFAVDVEALFGPRVTMQEGAVLPTMTVGGGVAVWHREGSSVSLFATGSFWFSGSTETADQVATSSGLDAGDLVFGFRFDWVALRWLELYAHGGAGPGVSALSTVQTFRGGQTVVRSFGAVELGLGVRAAIGRHFFVQVEPVALVDYFSRVTSSFLYSAQVGAGWRL